MSPDSATLTALGFRQAFTAEARDANGHAVQPSPTVTWASSDEAVATVGEDGVATAAGNGTATVSAAVEEGVVGSATVTVRQEIASVSLNVEWLAFDEPQATAPLTVSVSDAGGAPIEDPVVTWESSNEQVATVSAGGIVTAQGVGTATITVRAGAVRTEAGVTVNLWDPQEVHVITSFTGVLRNVGSYITTRTAADVNDDRNEDLVVAAWTACGPGNCGSGDGRNPPGSVKLFVRGTDGRLTDATVETFGQEVNAWVNVPVVTDFNHDGVPDVFLAGFTDVPPAEAPTTLLLSGPAGFEVRVYPGLTWGHGSRSADLDRDGCQDVIVGSLWAGDCAGNLVETLFVNATGRGSPNVIPIERTDLTLEGFWGGSDMCAADFDGDSSVDILYTNAGVWAPGNTPSPRDNLIQEMDWTTTPPGVREVHLLPAPVRDEGRPPGPKASHEIRCLVGDLDGDGDEDVFLSSTIGPLYWQGLEVADWSSQFQVYLNVGDWTFEDVSHVAFEGRGPWGAYGFSPLLRDFDGNGTLDLFYSGGNLLEQLGERPNPIWLGRGDGTFVQGSTPDLVRMVQAAVAKVRDHFGLSPGHLIFSGEAVPLRRATGEHDFVVPVTTSVVYPQDPETPIPTIALVYVPGGMY